MTPRTIALVASSFAPYIGGVEAHVAEVAKRLQGHGCTVEVWTVERAGRRGEREVGGIRVRDLPTPLPARSARSAGAFAVRAPGAWRAWASAYRSLRPELLHVHCFGPNGLYASALHRRFDIPLVLTSHGETLADDTGAYRRSALLRGGLARAIAASERVTAPSEYVLDDLRRSYGLVGGSVVPNGVDLTVHPDPAAPLPAPRGSYLLGVGRLGRMKGFDLLLDAFARAPLDPAVRLVIAGEGPERDRLLEQVGRLGLADRVVFAGRLSPQRVADFMAAALAVVVPSRAEAFGIVALEAWRAGAPVVMTDRGGAREFMGDGDDGLLVDPEDVDALAAALSAIVDDDELRRRLAAGGLERVREFSWDRVAEAYLSLYDAAPPR